MAQIGIFFLLALLKALCIQHSAEHVDVEKESNAPEIVHTAKTFAFLLLAEGFLEKEVSKKVVCILGGMKKKHGDTERHISTVVVFFASSNGRHN